MKKNLAISISNDLWGIGIHLTPMLGLAHVISAFHCNHSTQFNHEINALRAVTQLHIGETNEN